MARFPSKPQSYQTTEKMSISNQETILGALWFQRTDRSMGGGWPPYAAFSFSWHKPVLDRSLAPKDPGTITLSQYDHFYYDYF